MTNAEVILRLKDHFAIHDDGRPTPYLDEAERMAIEALEIADRLEQADADVYNKCCEVCTSLIICKERGEMCDEASAWEDGYNQALEDIRGENNG